jgi:HK97 family phage prohead protease
MTKMQNKIEYRSIGMTATEDENVVEGTAIVFSQETVIGKDRFGAEYREVVSPHALDGVDISDTPLKYNHDKAKANILARQRDKSLQVSVDDTGVHFSAEMRSNLGKDVYSAVKAGDISGCSFGFICEKDHIEKRDNAVVRYIDKIAKLTDLSIVDDPAYKQTSVEARSENTPEWVEEQAKKAELKQKLYLLTMC